MNKPLYIGILLLGAVLVGIFLTWPKYKDFLLTQKQVQEKQQVLRSRQDYYASLRGVEDSLRQYEAKLAKVKAAIPSDAQLPALYDSLVKEAAFSGLVVRGMAVTAKGESAGDLKLQSLPISMELVGSYQGIKQFLENVKLSSRIRSVDSLTFSGAETGAGFSLSIQMTAYSY